MLPLGTPAPAFTGTDEQGNIVKLSDFSGKKLVLYFYPKDSTPGCTAEACDLRDNYQRFLSLGYEILGVSKDSAASHQKFIAKYNLPFHLISDPDCKILKLYEAWGLKKMYGKESMGTLRTTYVIDEQGIIVDAIGKVDTKNHTAQVLRQNSKNSSPSGFKLYTLVLLVLLLWGGHLVAKDSLRVVRGYDGGMMVHCGYLQGTLSELNYQACGVPIGIGGLMSVHLGNHWAVGGEGYVSTLHQMHNGSYLKDGWGGLFGKFYWAFKHVTPYLGVTMGGGSRQTLLLFEGSNQDWQPEDNAVFHKQTFFVIDPFIGCEVPISKFLHLNFKIDCLTSIADRQLLAPIGPRFYIGCLFYH